MRKPLVLDSNVIFDVLGQREDVASRLADAMETAALTYLCPFVHFEVTRGFLHRPVPARERLYQTLSQKWQWDEINRSDWNLGSVFWARREGAGKHGTDADLMIAAYAVNRGATVVTADLRGFEDLPVAIENWRVEE